MKSMTVMLSTKADRKAAMKGNKKKSLRGSSFTHRALWRPSHRKKPELFIVSMTAIIPKTKRIVSQFS